MADLETYVLAKQSNAGRPPSPEEINRQNAVFWDRYHRYFAILINDEVIAETALDVIRSQLARGAAFDRGDEVEQAIQFSADAKIAVSRRMAVRAGKAPKADSLNLLIAEIVLDKPAITRDQLYNELVRCQHHGVIEDIDGEKINFKNHDDKIKSAETSGLKHRLSRAKKMIAQSR